VRDRVSSINDVHGTLERSGERMLTKLYGRWGYPEFRRAEGPTGTLEGVLELRHGVGNRGARVRDREVDRGLSVWRGMHMWWAVDMSLSMAHIRIAQGIHRRSPHPSAGVRG